MKMLLATALACLLQDVLNRRLLFKTNRSSSSTKGNHHPSFLRFWIGQKKNCRCSQNLWRRRNVVKTETQQTFVNGLLRFYYFRHLYSAGSACVLLTHRLSCPSIWATLSALLINILLFLFQLFLHSDQPLSEGEIIPFSGVCQSGRLHYPRRRRWWLHALTDRLFDVQPTTTSGNIITQSIIFSFSIS